MRTHLRVDGGDVGHDVYHIAAQLVRLNVHQRGVRREVDFGGHIEEERLVQHGALREGEREKKEVPIGHH